MVNRTESSLCVWTCTTFQSCTQTPKLPWGPGGETGELMWLEVSYKKNKTKITEMCNLTNVLFWPLFGPNNPSSILTDYKTLGLFIIDSIWAVSSKKISKVNTSQIVDKSGKRRKKLHCISWVRVQKRSTCDSPLFFSSCFLADLLHG